MVALFPVAAAEPSYNWTEVGTGTMSGGHPAMTFPRISSRFDRRLRQHDQGWAKGKRRGWGRGWGEWRDERRQKREARRNATVGNVILTEGPLPSCSVVFFHHVEKTGGTTIRTIFQRHAQLGTFDLMSFINRQNRAQLQMILQRLHSLINTPGGLVGLRLLVELHVGADLSHPYFFQYTLPDLLLIRSQVQSPPKQLTWQPAGLGPFC